MALFKRKKKKKTDVQSVSTYAPNSTLTSRPYTTPEALTKCEAESPGKIKKFLSKTKPDVYNEGFYDGEVEHSRDEALSELEEQYAERVEDIFTFFGCKGSGDFIVCEEKLAACDREIAEVERELEELKASYKKHNTPRKGEKHHAEA